MQLGMDEERKQNDAAKIVGELKRHGVFDRFRKQCLEDLEEKVGLF